MLLDIVAKSLYSNSEVFLRELISNASDALEKLRYAVLNENTNEDIGKLEVQIYSNKHDRTLTIQDNGIGMTKDELISNLGTIARSGSKAFLQELKNKNTDLSTIIGQFGVGFYSCFMVADKVEVFTKSRQADAKGYCWIYDGSGTYEIREVDNLPRGTKIVIHLKPEAREFADNTRIRSIIKKYSNFVNCPIFVNNEKCNVIQPLWLMDSKSVMNDQYTEFYRFISNSFDKPRFTLHYSVDAPLTVRALLYVPTLKPVTGELNRETNVALYTKRVLIKNKANEILPEWCSFMKGVVDSEDIPLNLSRELLQNSPLIAKLRSILTNRIIKFLLNISKKQPKEYNDFYKDYHIYLKAGVIYTDGREEKEEIAKLLKYETSNTKAGEFKSLSDYCTNMPSDQESIYYLFSPSRTLAESSPYFETLKKKGVEVIFCYEMFDEHVLVTLRTFRTKPIKSAEDELKTDNANASDFGENALNSEEINELIKWSKAKLSGKAANVKITNKLDSHPCVITVENMVAARHILKVQQTSAQLSDETRNSLLSACLELNPKHPIIKKMSALSKSDPDLATLLINQLFWNAMLAADLLKDPGAVLINMNELLTKALERH